MPEESHNTSPDILLALFQIDRDRDAIFMPKILTIIESGLLDEEQLRYFERYLTELETAAAGLRAAVSARLDPDHETAEAPVTAVALEAPVPVAARF